MFRPDGSGNKVYVIGHKNPDTDSVVATLCLAELEGLIPAKSGDFNNETKYVLKRFSVPEPKKLPKTKKSVVLVDHHEATQIPDGVKIDEIIGIYDHHKLGGLSTPEPIVVWIEFVGSTSTIIRDFYHLRGKIPTAKTASLLLAGIISDTLNLTSPTTTQRDRNAVEELNKIAKLNIKTLAEEMFEAKSDISGLKTGELLGKDYKVFTIQGHKIGIGVWETVSPTSILERKEEIIQKIAAKRSEEHLSHIYFAAIDILKRVTYVFISSDQEKKLAEKVWGGKVEEDVLVLPGVVSRKKQIVPPLERYLSKG